MNFTRTLTVLSWVRLKSHTIRGFMYCPNVSDGGVTTNSSARLVTGGEHHQHPHVGRQQVRTNELAQPSSVTENTTMFFNNEE